MRHYRRLDEGSIFYHILVVKYTKIHLLFDMHGICLFIFLKILPPFCGSGDVSFRKGFKKNCVR